MNLFRLMKALFTPASSETPDACTARLRAGTAVLVDVREAAEWKRGVIHEAMLLPLSDLTGGRAHWGPFLASAGNREILLYCASGARSGLAARILAQEGFKTTAVP
jgi:rhodanese-related sulfurtransferase